MDVEHGVVVPLGVCRLYKTSLQGIGEIRIEIIVSVMNPQIMKSRLRDVHGQRHGITILIGMVVDVQIVQMAVVKVQGQSEVLGNIGDSHSQTARPADIDFEEIQVPGLGDFGQHRTVQGDFIGLSNKIVGLQFV